MQEEAELEYMRDNSVHTGIEVDDIDEVFDRWYSDRIRRMAKLDNLRKVNTETMDMLVESFHVKESNAWKSDEKAPGIKIMFDNLIGIKDPE
eukprot:10122632-Karenia_brevis.AAC.1